VGSLSLERKREMMPCMQPSQYVACACGGLVSVLSLLGLTACPRCGRKSFRPHFISPSASTWYKSR
jgi:hypothetical protein